MKPEFMTFEECREEYGFGERELRALLNRKGCPVLPRRKNAPYQVVRSKFEEWLSSRVR